MHIIQILCTVPQNGDFQRVFLFVPRKRHARFRSVFFFTSSDSVELLFKYKISEVIFSQTRFTLKFTLKC